jgi:carbon storage regulator
MLVLSRRIGERIVIDDNICITVLEVSGERVRLGVVAPRSVRVDREEVHAQRALEVSAGNLDELAVSAFSAVPR